MSATITIERDIRVPMRDGVHLATDVYHPPGSGRHPVLVHRTPYSKDDWWVVGTLMFNPVQAVERGYAVVVQDSRGRFKSDGDWVPFFCEAPDGYDTVEWAAAQPWSDGRVGIYGSSYNGVTTVQALVAAPPHLKACVSYMTGANYHQGWVYSGGAFELAFNLWWALHQAWETVYRLGLDEQQLSEALGRLTRATLDPWDDLHHLPQRNHPLFRGGLAKYYDEWLQHPRYDEYWKQVDVVAQARQITVPVLQISCWYDGFLKGHLDLNEALKKHPDKRVRDTHEFVLGPWDHMSYLGVRKAAAGEREFGPIAVSGPTTVAPLALEWFDRWVAEKKTASPSAKRVRYFVMGSNEWHAADTWPPAHTPVWYYLRSGGRANSRFGDGALATQAPGNEPPDSYVYDPARPVPSFGSKIMAPSYSPPGVQDQARTEERDDVLVYTSAQLSAPLTIAGPASATLFITSNAVDTDFTAKLVDVQPDGYCAPIADGILRARYRKGMDREELLVSGEVVELTVDLLAVAHAFNAGHRIRLEVSSSNFPKYDRNLNVAASPAAAGAEEMRRAAQQVFHDSRRPSHISLPVIA
jgi:putative CocE/NonD family hydrolase